MGQRPRNYTLERLNNKKGYTKSNCVWASITSQNRNKKNVKLNMKLAENIRKSNESLLRLSQHYKVSMATISRIKHNLSWKKECK